MRGIPKKYSGRYVAFIGKRLVSDGKNSLEAYTKAKRLYPKRMVTLLYVPTKKETVTFL